MSQLQNSTFAGSIYDVYTTASQKYIEGQMPRIGQVASFEDGRAYRFVSTGAAINAGQVVSSVICTAEMAGKFTAAAAGAREVTLTDTPLDSTTINQYAGGFLVVTESAAGVVTSYKIKSNTADGGDDAVTFTLHDPLVVAIAAADDAIIVPPRFSGVEVGTADSDAIGVAVNDIASGGFGWVQCEGIGGVEAGTGAASLLKGIQFILGAAGAVEPQTDAGEQATYGRILEVTAAVGDGDLLPAMLCFP